MPGRRAANKRDAQPGLWCATASLANSSTPAAGSLPRPQKRQIRHSSPGPGPSETARCPPHGPIFRYQRQTAAPVSPQANVRPGWRHPPGRVPGSSVREAQSGLARQLRGGVGNVCRMYVKASPCISSCKHSEQIEVGLLRTGGVALKRSAPHPGNALHVRQGLMAGGEG